MSQYSTQGYGTFTQVVNGLAYSAADEFGLQILNVSDPFIPQFIGSLSFAGDAVSLLVIGNYCYICVNSNGVDSGGIVIADISHPTLPILINSITFTGDNAMSIKVINGIALVGSTFGLYSINITNPFVAHIVGFLRLNSSALGLVLNSENTKIFIANNASGLTCIDISNCSQMQVVFSIFTIENVTINATTSIAFSNNIFYITDSNVGFVAFENCSMCNSSLNTPIFQLIKQIFIQDASDIAIDGKYAYVSSMIHIIPNNFPSGYLTMISLVSFTFISTSTRNTFCITKKLNSNYIYLADGSQGIKVFNQGSPVLVGSNPFTQVIGLVLQYGQFIYISSLGKLSSILIATNTTTNLLYPASNQVSIQSEFYLLAVSNDGSIMYYCFYKEQQIHLVQTQTLLQIRCQSLNISKNSFVLALQQMINNAYFVICANESVIVLNMTQNNTNFITKLPCPQNSSFYDVFASNFSTQNYAFVLGQYNNQTKTGIFVYSILDNQSNIPLLSVWNSTSINYVYSFSLFNRSIQKNSSYIIVADYYQGVSILNIDNPYNISFVSGIPFNGSNVTGIEIYLENYTLLSGYPKTLMCIADYNEGLFIIDITNITAAFGLWSYQLKGQTLGLSIQQDFAFVVTTYGVKTVQISWQHAYKMTIIPNILNNNEMNSSIYVAAERVQRFQVSIWSISDAQNTINATLNITLWYLNSSQQGQNTFTFHANTSNYQVYNVCAKLSSKSIFIDCKNVISIPIPTDSQTLQNFNTVPYSITTTTNAVIYLNTSFNSNVYSIIFIQMPVIGALKCNIQNVYVSVLSNTVYNQSCIQSLQYFAGASLYTEQITFAVSLSQTFYNTTANPMVYSDNISLDFIVQQSWLDANWVTILSVTLAIAGIAIPMIAGAACWSKKQKKKKADAKQQKEMAIELTEAKKTTEDYV